MEALPKTWIVVADGAHASVLNYRGPKQPLVPVEGGSMNHINEPTRELVSDRRGRVVHSGDNTQFARDFSTDPHEHEKQRFAEEVADFLEKRTADYERLVLVAPPKTLGALRQRLPRTVREKIHGELDKELTNVPLDQLPEHLQDVINIESLIN